MKVALFNSRLPIGLARRFVVFACALALLPGDQNLFAFHSSLQSSAPAEEQAATIPPGELDSLVAPIALYPDPLLSQTLVAATYPLEIIQLQQWLGKNSNLKDQALADAVKKQDWDPSIQSMAALPDLVKQLADNIKWTTDLGNAFLAQQSDVMDAVQRMRKKAKDGGNLKSSEQQKVETKVVESKQVIVIEQASPEVIYVPSYNPTVVYGAPVYPYPPIAYPPPGYYAAGMAISFGIGIAMGAAWGGGGWGYNCGWGGNNNITINNNNNFVRNSNRQNVSNRNGGTWQHNPQHRGGAPYSNRATAGKYGGTARGDSMSTRQANARQNQGQRGGLQQAADRSSMGNSRDRSANGRDTGNRGGNGAGSNAGSNRGAGDRVGNRSTSGSGGSRNSGAFGGASGGSSGKSARASSSRGSSSMGGGGGRSGGGRSGGGGRRR
ncbi:MAG TPA: DUF3300 domain-containing protein [Terriglobales bacterium]|jgi:hypothetical protein|nr:DUF3300 domain-containing protein [Terriglobales bacterium]